MEIMVHSKNSVSTKVSKELYHFNRNFQFKSVMLKMIQFDIRSGDKNLTASVVRTPTPTLPKTLRRFTVPTPTPQTWTTVT